MNALPERALRIVGQLDLTPCDGCDSCGLRCAAGVPMSCAEFEAVREYREAAPDRAEIARVAAQDKTVALGDGVTVQACRFYDVERGRCAVYPVRPLMCRLMGHVEWMPCPIGKVARPLPTADALALLRAYATCERRTFEAWELEGTDVADD